MTLSDDSNSETRLRSELLLGRLPDGISAVLGDVARGTVVVGISDGADASVLVARDCQKSLRWLTMLDK